MRGDVTHAVLPERGVLMETLRPDICVIGAGSGGLSVAAGAAALGVPVVLIEKDRMGGDCLNTGCVPSKSLIAAAHRAHALRNAAPFGIDAGPLNVEFGRVHDHVQSVIAAISPTDSAARFRGLGVNVIAGVGRFTDPDTVAVGDRTLVKARRFVIATGARPVIPPVPGLDSVPYLTNETIFNLRDGPRHLIIIGGGPIGLELAQAFRRLGAEVTVIEAATPLAAEDPECATVVIDRLTAEGVDMRIGAKVTGVAGGAADSDAVTVTLETPGGTDTIAGSHLLIATGRRPAFGELALDKAGIFTAPDGIVVNRSLRTANRRVYAIGDCVAGPQFTHAANYQAGLVLRAIVFRLPVKVRHEVIPRVTYTDPELAQAGMTEAQAREQYRAIRILRWPFYENDRAQTERDTTGHIKVVTTAYGRILGATIVGIGAGDQIALWALAFSKGLNVRAMTNVVFPYPTRTEAAKRAAVDFFVPGLTKPWLRRIIGVLRGFG